MIPRQRACCCKHRTNLSLVWPDGQGKKSQGLKRYLISMWTSPRLCLGSHGGPFNLLNSLALRRMGFVLHVYSVRRLISQAISRYYFHCNSCWWITKNTFFPPWKQKKRKTHSKVNRFGCWDIQLRRHQTEKIQTVLVTNFVAVWSLFVNNKKSEGI